MSPTTEAEPPCDPDADRHAPEECRRLSGPGLRVFMRIADLWRLDEDQRRLVLGLPDRSTYQLWLEAAREHIDLELPVDVLMRISAVLGIHQALSILHAEERDGVTWLRGVNRTAPFDDRTPLDLTLDGSLDGLLAVRRFLDALADGQGMEPRYSGPRHRHILAQHGRHTREEHSSAPRIASSSGRPFASRRLQ